MLNNNNDDDADLFFFLSFITLACIVLLYFYFCDYCCQSKQFKPAILVLHFLAISASVEHFLHRRSSLWLLLFINLTIIHIIIAAWLYYCWFGITLCCYTTNNHFAIDFIDHNFHLQYQINNLFSTNAKEKKPSGRCCKYYYNLLVILFIMAIAKQLLTVLCI